MTPALQQLLTKLKALEEKRTPGEWVEMQAPEGNKKLVWVDNTNSTLIQMLETAVGALEYYAEGWHYQLTDGIEEQEILKDGGVQLKSGDLELENGEKAREALSWIEEAAKGVGE